MSSTQLAANIFKIPSRSFVTTSCLHKKVASRYQISLRGDKPITYEEAMPNYQIAKRKGFLSWNTGSIKGFEESSRRAETNIEELFIRKFMEGTWHKLFLQPIIIKRRGNVITIGGIVLQSLQPRKVYFLIGYTEEILSYILKCPVKLELQTVADKNAVTFKYI